MTVHQFFSEPTVTNMGFLNFFRRPAKNALNTASTQVLRNALRNYIKAVDKFNKNKLTTKDIQNVLTQVVGNNNKRIIKNRLANGVAQIIIADRLASQTGRKLAIALSAGPKGTINETAAAKNVNNATKNINRAYIMSTIIKNISKLNTPNKKAAAVQAMINYNPKINFKSLGRPGINTQNLLTLYAMANNAANAKYGANRKTKNTRTSLPSTETNAVNMPSGFFNEKNAAERFKKANNNATIQTAIKAANAIKNTSPRANINAAISLLQNALKLGSNQTVRNNIRRRITNLERKVLLAPPPPTPNAAMTKKIGNYIWNIRAYGGPAGTMVNTNFPQIARRILANSQYNVTKTTKAALNAYLSTKKGYNQAHRNRALAISKALYAPPP